MPALLPLSTYSQGGDGEFSGMGPPLSSVLANAKVGTWDMGQPIQTTYPTYPTVMPYA